MKAQWKHPDGKGGFYVVHHETKAEVVKYSDTTVAAVLDKTDIPSASAFMKSLLAAEDAFAAREILKVGKERVFDETGKRWTPTSIMISPTEKKFGESSLYLNGSAYLRQMNGITLGGKDFAIAGWIYPSAVNTVQYFISWGNDADTRLNVGIGSNGGILHWICSIGGTSIFNDDSSGSCSAKEWMHVEIDYRNSDNKIFLFLNGIKADERTVTGLSTARTMVFHIGKHTTSSNYNFKGYVDEIFITEELLHTEDFTPPTAPYEFDSDTTVALLHFED